MNKISNLVVAASNSGEESDRVGEKGKEGKKGGKSLEERQDNFFALAHSHSEEVIQPTMLVGGTLKPYQIKGLQWMVSLYNRCVMSD